MINKLKNKASLHVGLPHFSRGKPGLSLVEKICP